MAFSSYSLTPASNTSINGINIAENCPAANVNNALRQIASDGKALSDTVAAIDTSGFMPKSGGAFTAVPTKSGNGAFWYFNSSSLIGGAVLVQPVSTALPTSPAEGTVVFQY